MPKNKGDESSLDDLDSILASLEGDDDLGLDEKPKNKREAIEKVLKDGGTGFIDHFKSEPVEKVKKFVDEAVPRGIRPEYDFVKDSVNEVKKVFEKDGKEIRSNTKELIDIIKTKMPDNSGVKNILNKISNKLGVETENTYRGPSQDEIITETLDTLFKQKDARESTREAITELKENNKFKEEVKLTSKIIANLELKNDFDRNYTLNYYRKSIELKMKTMLISKELLETTQSSYRGFTQQFEALIKNTSLPDLIKLRNSEQTAETFKQRVRENLADMFFTAATPLETMKKNIISKSRDIIGNVSSGLSMGLMGAQGANMAGDMGGMVSKSYLAGGQLGEWASEFASEFASRELEDNQTVRDKLRKAKLLFADPKEAFFDLASKESEKNTLMSRFKARLYKTIGKLGQTEENNRIKIRENAPDDPSFFDFRTKNSIVKVIPMILSKIYGEVRSLRTGEEPSGIYYDYTSGKLEENKNIKKRLKNNIKAALSGVAGSNLENIMSMLENDEDGNLDEATKNEYKSAILSYLIKDGSISPEGLNKDKFLELVPENLREDFKKRYSKVMDKSKIDIKLIDDIKDRLYGIKANTPFIDKVVEDMYKNGNIEEIIKMGILDYDDKEGIYTVNKDKYRALLDSSLKEMNKYEPSSFNASNVVNNDDDDNDSMMNIFRDTKKHVYDKANKKYDIDTKLKKLEDKVEELNKTYKISERLEDVKNLSLDDLKDPEKRKRLLKKSRVKLKRGRKTLDTKIEDLKQNMDLIAEMTPEEIKDYILSQQPSLEAWMDNKIKNSKELANIQISNLRNTDTVKTSEANINSFIKNHRLKGRYSLLKNKVLKQIHSTSDKYDLENKIAELQSQANIGLGYGKDKILSSKALIEQQAKKFGFVSIENQNRLAPNISTNDFSNYTFKDTERFRKLRNTKLKDILSLDKVNPEELHDLYKKSDEHLAGMDFLTWARTLRLKFVNGQFIKMPEDVKFENLRSSVVEYLSKQAQGIFNKDKKDKEGGIKSIFGILPGMTPLQILGKVLKKTREWDRKIMFDIVPKAMGKVFKFPFKAIKGGAKMLYKGVFNRNTMNFARVLAGLDPIYPDGEKGKMNNLKAGLDKTRDLDKKILKGTPGFLGKLIKTPFMLGKMAKDGIGAGWNWMNGRPIKPKEEKSPFDADGDGDIDGSWRDQLNEKEKHKNDKHDIPQPLKKEEKKDNGLWGLLSAGFFGITSILKKVFGAIGLSGKLLKGILGGVKFIPKVLKFGFKGLTGLVGGLLTKMGILGGGAKLAEELIDDVHVKPKVDLKPDIDKKVDIDPKKVKKPDSSKIMNLLRSFKDKIIAKLGPKASVRVLATLSAKIASRLVPFAGVALLAYDAAMIAKDMYNGTSFESAVSRQILGFDLFNEDEPILDEDGNPVKPDEMTGEEFAKDELVDQYLDKQKGSAEDAERFRQEYGLSMEEIAKRMQKKKSNEAYMSSTEYSTAYQKAMNTKNVLNKSGKSLSETYGSGMDLTSGTFNLAKSKEAIGKMLDDVAKQTGVEPNILKTFAAIESGFDPMASAGTSSAKGLFQFLDSTWKDMLSKYGDKYGIQPGTSQFDPMANSLMGAEFIKENTKILNGVKKDVNAADLYLAHFLGPGGAKKILSADPSASAASLMPAPASANPTIFYKNGVPRTVGELYQFMQNLVAKKAKDFGFSAGPGVTPTPETTNTPTTSTSNQPTNPPNGIINDSYNQDVAKSNTPTSNTENVPKVPTTSNVTSGFVPQNKTVMTSQPEVDFSKNNDVLQKSLEVQQSMDGTLKAILAKLDGKSPSSNTQAEITPKEVKENVTIASPEAVVDLTKKRY